MTEHTRKCLNRLRPTRQRLALANLLVGDGRNRHVTAESLHAAAQASGEPVSLATVYNTLRSFCDAGLMQEVTVDGSKSYFDTRMDDQLEIRSLPKPPDGVEISKVDVVIRLRRR